MTEVKIDFTKCRGRGVCIDMLPESLGEDDWGFPIVRGPVPDSLLEQARKAATLCPKRALFLD